MVAASVGASVSAAATKAARVQELVLDVLRARPVPVRGRVQLLYHGLRAGLGRATPFQLSLGRGSVYFGADSADQRAFRDVFAQNAYAIDFTGAVVLDIGAHKGYFGAYALLNGARAVISYEPERENFAALAAAASSFRQAGAEWTPHRAAVGATATHGLLRVADASWAHSLETAFRMNSPAARSQSVQIKSMAQTLSALSSGRRLVVKIDAEGSECQIVLETPLEHWRHVDDALIEMHDFAPCRPHEISSHLQRAGLTPETLEASVLVLRRH